MTEHQPEQQSPSAMEYVSDAHFKRMIGMLDRPLLAILAPLLLSLTLSVIPSLFSRVPLPDVQDEFAHLLAADTFAHGRLTNPSPPLWPFFESVHILVHPTYMSKYLPGQGLVLALGQRLGLPILGVWLTAAAACGAIGWLLLGCLPPTWALIGGLLSAGHPLLMWWSQTYWGGDVALLGSTLLTGVAIRLVRLDDYRQHWAWLAGIGCGLLLLSRPLEGAMVGLLLSAALFRIGWTRKCLRHLLRPTPIMALLLLVTATWLAYFNYRITGSPWQMPYTLAARQYMTAPLMYWQPVPQTPEYHSAFMAHFYRDYEWPEYLIHTSGRGFFLKAGSELWHLFHDFAGNGWLAAVPFLLGLTQLRLRAIQLSLLVLLCLPILEIGLTPWMRNQYMAPAVGGFFVVLVVGYQRLSQWSFAGVRVGVAGIGLLLALQAIQTGKTEWDLFHPPATSLGAVRQQLIDQLHAADSRKKLLFVRHLLGGSFSDVVYNSADIDGQDIIFARDFGDDLNRRLMTAYPDREAWLLTFETIELKRYHD